MDVCMVCMCVFGSVHGGMYVNVCICVYMYMYHMGVFMVYVCMWYVGICMNGVCVGVYVYIVCGYRCMVCVCVCVCVCAVAGMLLLFPE